MTETRRDIACGIHRTFSMAALAACSLLAVLQPGLASAQSDDTELLKPEVVPAGKQRNNPYRLVGRVRMFFGKHEYLGTGTVASAHGVLTCGHNMFSRYDGFSVEILFERGLKGLHSLQTVKPRSVVILGGYKNAVERKGTDSAAAFSKDLAVMKFPALLAGGQHVIARAELAWLKTDGAYRESLGYGADNHDGQTLLFVGDDSPWSVFRTGYYKNENYLLEHGMSGGPTIMGTKNGTEIVAVNVSGSGTLSGFRVIDNRGMTFLRQNL